jgi:hypothetical protein
MLRRAYGRFLGFCSQSARSQFCRTIEPLEQRRLLCAIPLEELTPAPEFDWGIEAASQAEHAADGGPEVTDIVWTNRGLASDGFAANFGTSANAGREVVDAVLESWERIITNWNRTNGSISLQVTISIVNTNGFGASAAPGATAPADGKPTTGSINMQRGNNSADPNDSNGWFFDPTPFDNSEFMGTILNGYAGVDSAGVGSDFFSVVSAELVHVLGLISDKNNNGGSWDDYRLESSGLATFTDIDDNAEGGGNGHFWVFDGPTIDHLMTSFNSGDPNDLSWGNIVHSAGAAGNINFAAKNWRGSEDSGNAIYGNERTLPSYVMTYVLADAYGYTVTDPETFAHFYAVLNETTNVLTVRGGALDSADSVVVQVNGAGQLQVSVDIGDDIPGSGNLSGVGNLNAFTTLFNVADVSSIVVNVGDGNDSLNVLELPSGINITANMGAGNDFVNIGGNDLDSNILGNVTIDAGTGTSDDLQISDSTDNVGSDVYTLTSTTFDKTDFFDTFTYSGIENVTLNCSAFPNTINVTSFSNISTGLSSLRVNAGDGADQINLGNGDLELDLAFTSITVDGGLADDTLFLDDTTDAEGLDDYTLTSSTFDKNTAGLNLVNFLATEAIRLDANGFDNQINLNGAPTSSSITVNGGNGNDTFDVGDGDLDNNLVFVTGSLNGGNGNDNLNLNDQSDLSGVDTFVMTATTFDKGNTGVINYSSFLNIVFNGSAQADDIDVTGFGGFTTINGNAGDDDILLDGSYIGTSSVVDVGTGADILRINEDGAGSTPVRILSSQTMAELRIGAGGFLDVAVGGDKTLRVNDSVVLEGRINLQDNFFIRGTGTLGNLAFYTLRLTNGYNGGDWLGAEPAIISTPANDTTHSLGYARASEIFGGGGGVFGGQLVPADAILIRFTRYGDANLSGNVNLQDFNRLAANFGQLNKVWSDGNLNYDANINLQDFNKLAANFGTSVGPDAASESRAPLPKVVTDFGRRAARQQTDERADSSDDDDESPLEQLVGRSGESDVL